MSGQRNCCHQSGRRVSASTSEGVNSPVEGVNSPVEGVNSSVEGVNSSAEGVNSSAEGVNSPAEGVNLPAEGARVRARSGSRWTEGDPRLAGMAEKFLSTTHKWLRC
eukprot:1176504-Prorocentrum_minimum.AAC.1